MEIRATADSTNSGTPLIEQLIQLLLSTIVAIGLLAALLCSLAYINAYYDDTAYHIPNAVRMAFSWSISTNDSPQDASWFPGGAELIISLLVAVFKSARLTNLSGFLMYALILWLLWGMSAFFTRDKIFRVAVLALAASIPLMLAQTMAFYVDIHMAATYVAVGYFALKAIETRLVRHSYFALACAIALAGIKYSGLIWFFIALPVIVYCFFHAKERRPPDWASSIALIAALLFAGGWYIRNFLARGNPTYPFLSGVYGKVMTAIGFKFQWDPTHGLISPVTTSWRHPWMPESSFAYRHLPDMTNDGFGLATTFALVLCGFAFLRFRLLSPTLRRGLLALLWLALGMTFATHIGRETPRYILAVPLLACLAPAIWRATFSTSPNLPARLAAPGLSLVVALHYFAFNVLVAHDKVALAQSWSALRDGSGTQIIDYAQTGGLRIGYVAGHNEFISRLYDLGLTNQLVELQFKNYDYHWPRQEIDSEADFVSRVRALHLDAIQIFDPDNPTTPIVRRYFPELIHESSG